MLGELFQKPSAPTGPPRIIFVCTGNICRSPLAAGLFQRRAAGFGRTDIVISSAGLRAVVDAPMDRRPAEIALRHGAPTTHRGTQLTRDLSAASSMLLTMTRSQRDDLTREYPAALKRTFTLAEMVRLLREHADVVGGLDGRAMRQPFDVSMDASRNRALVELRSEDDVEDPYRRSDATHERVGAQIVGLVDDLADAMFASGGRSRSPE